MTHSSNVCGNIYDIECAESIAHRNNVQFMVDAAQSAGSVPIDIKNIDLLAFPGHKGLLGPMGTGGLYVAEGVKIIPVIEDGTGSASESLIQPDFFPDILESGTQSVTAIAAENTKLQNREGKRIEAEYFTIFVVFAFYKSKTRY